MPRLICSFLTILAVLTLWSNTVLAQQPRDNSGRLDQIEHELKTLGRAVYGGRGVASTGVSNTRRSDGDAEIRLQQLEIELRKITGKLEEQNYLINKLQAKVDRTYSDLNLRISDVERNKTPPPQKSPNSVDYSRKQPVYKLQSGNLANTAGGTISKPSQSLSPPPTTGKYNQASVDMAASLYENAFALMKSSQYERSEKEFSNFISKYPGHVLAGNAKYWLGETFYVRGKYEQAARIFAEGYQIYPNGAKAPDNLLKLGMSLAGLGNKDDACVSLRQLEKEYPSGAGPVLRRAKQEISRLGC